MAGRNWRFRQETFNGTVLLDKYREGTLLDEGLTQYAASDQPMGAPPVDQDNTPYTGLKIFWTRPMTVTTRRVEGDAEWLGHQTVFQYDVGEHWGN